MFKVLLVIYACCLSCGKINERVCLYLTSLTLNEKECVYIDIFWHWQNTLIQPFFLSALHFISLLHRQPTLTNSRYSPKGPYHLVLNRTNAIIILSVMDTDSSDVSGVWSLPHTMRTTQRDRALTLSFGQTSIRAFPMDSYGNTYDIFPNNLNNRQDSAHTTMVYSIQPRKAPYTNHKTV